MFVGNPTEQAQGAAALRTGEYEQPGSGAPKCARPLASPVAARRLSGRRSIPWNR
jgi:hypothetical protein